MSRRASELKRKRVRKEAFAILYLKHFLFSKSNTFRSYKRNFCFYKSNSYFTHLLIFFKFEFYIIISTFDRKVIKHLFSHLVIIIMSVFVKDLFYNLLLIKLKAILYYFIFTRFSKILFYNFLDFENANEKILVDNIVIL